MLPSNIHEVVEAVEAAYTKAPPELQAQALVVKASAQRLAADSAKLLEFCGEAGLAALTQYLESHSEPAPQSEPVPQPEPEPAPAEEEAHEEQEETPIVPEEPPVDVVGPVVAEEAPAEEEHETAPADVAAEVTEAHEAPELEEEKHDA